MQIGTMCQNCTANKYNKKSASTFGVFQKLGDVGKIASNMRGKLSTNKYGIKYEYKNGSIAQNKVFNFLIITFAFFAFFLCTMVMLSTNQNKGNVEAILNPNTEYVFVLALGELVVDDALVWGETEASLKSDTSVGNVAYRKFQSAIGTGELPFEELTEKFGLFFEMTVTINGETMTYTQDNCLVDYNYQYMEYEYDSNTKYNVYYLLFYVDVIGAVINYYDSDGTTLLTTGEHINDTTTTLYTPKKAGYVFDGWYTSSDCSGTPVTALTGTYTAPINLYANWVVDEMEVNLTATINCENSMLLLTILDETGAQVAEIGFVTGQTINSINLKLNWNKTYKILVTKPFGSVLTTTGVTQTSSTTYTFTTDAKPVNITFVLSGNGRWSNTVVI